MTELDISRENATLLPPMKSFQRATAYHSLLLEVLIIIMMIMMMVINHLKLG